AERSSSLPEIATSTSIAPRRTATSRPPKNSSRRSAPHERGAGASLPRIDVLVDHGPGHAAIGGILADLPYGLGTRGRERETRRDALSVRSLAIALEPHRAVPEFTAELGDLPGAAHPRLLPLALGRVVDVERHAGLALRVRPPLENHAVAIRHDDRVLPGDRAGRRSTDPIAEPKVELARFGPLRAGAGILFDQAFDRDEARVGPKPREIRVVEVDLMPAETGIGGARQPLEREVVA